MCICKVWSVDIPNAFGSCNDIMCCCTQWNQAHGEDHMIKCEQHIPAPKSVLHRINPYLYQLSKRAQWRKEDTPVVRYFWIHLFSPCSEIYPFFRCTTFTDDGKRLGDGNSYKRNASPTLSSPTSKRPDNIVRSILQLERKGHTQSQVSCRLIKPILKNLKMLLL